MNQTQRLYPSPVPEGETTAAEEPAFVHACMSTASDLAAAHDWRLGRSILTHSDVWGLVWRIDFRVKDQSQESKLINRFVCWGTADGEILGTATVVRQNVEPL
jgi:hypothetical protein